MSDKNKINGSAPDATIKFAPGQCWTYKTISGFDSSRIIVGAVEFLPDEGDIVCITVTDAPVPTARGGPIEAHTMPFIPFSAEALAGSVVEQLEDVPIPDEFPPMYESWMEDTGGSEFLTITLRTFFELLADGMKE